MKNLEIIQAQQRIRNSLDELKCPSEIKRLILFEIIIDMEKQTDIEIKAELTEESEVESNEI